MKSPLRGGLLGRIVLHGVVLLAVSAIGFVGIAVFLWGSEIDRVTVTFAEWAGRQACERVADPVDGAEEVARFPLPVAVFDTDGRTLAASRTAALPPLSAALRMKIREGAILVSGTRIFAVSCPGAPSRFALVGGPPTPVPLGRLGFLVAALVGLVTVASIPLARSLVRPLRELLAVVNRVGTGDLGARANTTRRDEIGDLARACDAMAANLEAHLRAEKELLANVSHELRTPLARVRVVLETAEEDPGRTTSLLREIGRDLADLEQLTDDVLATLRLDFTGTAMVAAKMRLRPERVDVVAILRSAVARCAEDAPERDIELEAPDALPPIDGDPALLLRLFKNVLENARNYSTATIHVRATCDEAAVIVDVVDQGIGIDEADLERIFDPFFRSDRSRVSSTGGTGIGLTLCRRIVEVHDGTIAARSSPGRTTMTVRLPRTSMVRGTPLRPPRAG